MCVARRMRSTYGGSVSYPGERLPEDYNVCAIPYTEGEAICTTDIDGFEYETSVEPGDYTVYAISSMHEYVAYYNQCSVTDQLEGCPSKNPNTNIVVSADKDRPATNTNPTTFYGPADYQSFVSD